jgi:hypothetical protein
VNIINDALPPSESIKLLDPAISSDGDVDESWIVSHDEIKIIVDALLPLLK